MPPPAPPSLIPSRLRWLSALLMPLLLAGAGGWLCGQADGLTAGASLLLAAVAAALQAVLALRRRIRAVLADSTEALHRLGQGNNGFVLDTRGLDDFDALLLAIHDLREAAEVIEQPRPQGRLRRLPPQRGFAVALRPAAVAVGS